MKIDLFPCPLRPYRIGADQRADVIAERSLGQVFSQQKLGCHPQNWDF